MLTPKTEGNYAGEFLLAEPFGEYLRLVVTVISGQVLEAGAVLGKITASGKYTAVDADATDGSEAAAGVLYDDVDASGGDTPGLAIVKQAVVQKNKLKYLSTMDAGEQTTAEAELEALTVYVRS